MRALFRVKKYRHCLSINTYWKNYLIIYTQDLDTKHTPLIYTLSLMHLINCMYYFHRDNKCTLIDLLSFKQLCRSKDYVPYY